MTKQMLRDYSDLIKNISADEEELARIDDQLNKITSVISGLPHGSNVEQDKLSVLVAAKVDLANTLNDKLLKRMILRQNIEYAIECLNEKDQRLIKMRYVDGQSFEQIAVTLGYTYRHVTRLHGHILQKMS